jgi:hypothetical protein
MIGAPIAIKEIDMVHNHSLSYPRSLALVLGLVVLAAISLSIWLLSAPLPTLNSPAVNGPAQIGHAGAQQVARAADVARWEAMGQFYAPQQADTARWEAMGDFYADQATVTVPAAVKYGPPGR